MMWSYMTPAGTKEGPFETGKMRHWFVEGYFRGSTPIRLEGEDSQDFLPLSEFYPDVREAFTSVPRCSRRLSGQASPQILGNIC